MKLSKTPRIVIAKPILKKVNDLTEDISNTYGHYLKHNVDGFQKQCVKCGRFSIKVCNTCNVPLHIECMSHWHNEKKSKKYVSRLNI